MNKIKKLKTRLNRIGIDVEFKLNFPWIYLDKVNGIRVTERFIANHGFTAAFLRGEDVQFSDRKKLFREIRKLCNSPK